MSLLLLPVAWRLRPGDNSAEQEPVKKDILLRSIDLCQLLRKAIENRDIPRVKHALGNSDPDVQAGAVECDVAGGSMLLNQAIETGSTQLVELLLDNNFRFGLESHRTLFESCLVSVPLVQLYNRKYGLYTRDTLRIFTDRLQYGRNFTGPGIAELLRHAPDWFINSYSRSDGYLVVRIIKNGCDRTVLEAILSNPRVVLSRRVCCNGNNILFFATSTKGPVKSLKHIPYASELLGPHESVSMVADAIVQRHGVAELQFMSSGLLMEKGWRTETSILEKVYIHITHDHHYNEAECYMRKEILKSVLLRYRVDQKLGRCPDYDYDVLKHALRCGDAEEVRLLLYLGLSVDAFKRYGRLRADLVRNPKVASLITMLLPVRYYSPVDNSLAPEVRSLWLRRSQMPLSLGQLARRTFYEATPAKMRKTALEALVKHGDVLENDRAFMLLQED